jgi:hypothetical protein
MLLLTVFLSFATALDCSNKASWGCDKITDTATECYGAAAKFCGVCKDECQDGGSEKPAEPTTTKEPCKPKATTCKVCTSDMDCNGKLFSITTYEEGKNGRFGCTYAENYEFVNESDECPRGNLMIKEDAECKSGDEFVGLYASLEGCADAVAKEGGRFFIYGKSYKSMGCYKENMKTAKCEAGWEEDKFNVYENIVCIDDEEKVKADMFDERATCTNTIETYNSYGVDLCAPDSDFRRSCCATCSAGQSAMIANRASGSTGSTSVVVNGFAALGLGFLLYGAYKHYAK